MSSSSPMSPPDGQQQQHANGPLRRLLPSENAANDGGLSREKAAPRPAPPAQPPTATLLAPPRRKRGQATTAACGACRKRKSKCDGQRPTCSICRDRGTACEFDTKAAETHSQALKRKFSELQSQKSAFEEVYEVLQTRSEKEAEEVYRRIRRGADAGSILRHVNYGDVLVQLALVPETRYRFEFPYLPGMPPFLCRQDNPYLDSEVYDCALRAPPNPRQTGRTDLVCAPGPRDPYLKPYLSATVVHPWLESVRPSRWTSVSTDDALMQKILHDYLLLDYDWFTFFHKDYFLEDMAAENQRFCSQLLVNAVLCAGCFCHNGLEGRAEYWNPKNLGYQFFAEANRLFDIDAEQERPFRIPGDPDWERKNREWEQRRLVTIQAAMLLNLVANLNGTDKIGWRRYTLKAIEMASEIQLLGHHLEHHGPEMQCVRTYTAWALFCWQSLSSYYYRQLPPIREHPQTPLPDPLQQPQWYGELWLRYPLSQTPWPSYHGSLFKAKADFWIIMNEVSALNFSHHRSPTTLSAEEILPLYARLRAWFQNLPDPLTAKRIVLPQQLKLHMHYCQMVIDLVTPILGQTELAGVPLAPTPRDIYMDAVMHLETLLRIYYLRHGFEGADSFITPFLGLLNYMTVNAIETSTGSSFLESRRSTLLLLTKGLHDQGRSHFLARVVLRLQASSMRPEDVELLKQFVEISADSLIYGPLEQTVHSDWPVYEVGLEAKAEMRRQGKMLAIRVASLSLESSASPTPSRSPTSQH